MVGTANRDVLCCAIRWPNRPKGENVALLLQDDHARVTGWPLVGEAPNGGSFHPESRHGDPGSYGVSCGVDVLGRVSVFCAVVSLDVPTYPDVAGHG